MTSLFTLRALLFAGECLLASALLPALAFVATRFIRAASLRHLVWLTVLGTLLMLPLAALVVPPHMVVARVETGVPMLPDTAVSTAISAAPAAMPALDTHAIAIVLLAVWLLGFVWASLRLATGAICLDILRRQSRPHALRELPNIPAARRECELRLSESQGGPLTWGFLRPVILLPKSSLHWTRERLHAVLMHELAHVRRHDSLMQAMGLFVCALYWINPLVWMAAKSLHREAEIAADDAVITAGFTPSTYAGELLQLAQEFRGQGPVFAGMSMAAQSALEARVKSLLAQGQMRRGATRLDIVKIACVGLVATGLLAFARPDVVAQQSARAPAAVRATPVPVVAAASTPLAVQPIAEPRRAVHASHAQHVQLAAARPSPLEPVDEAPPQDEAAIAEDIDSRPDGEPVHRGLRIVQYDEPRITEADAEKIRAVEERRLRRVEAEARRTARAYAETAPQIEKEIAAARIDEQVNAAMQQAAPHMEEAAALALSLAGPAIKKAIADAHIGEKVARALRDAQPKIDAAIARAQAKADAARARGDLLIDE